jgi:hypothetical protein
MTAQPITLTQTLLKKEIMNNTQPCYNIVHRIHPNKNITIELAIMKKNKIMMIKAGRDLT